MKVQLITCPIKSMFYITHLLRFVVCEKRKRYIYLWNKVVTNKELCFYNKYKCASKHFELAEDDSSEIPCLTLVPDHQEIIVKKVTGTSHFKNHYMSITPCTTDSPHAFTLPVEIQQRCRRLQTRDKLLNREKCNVHSSLHNVQELPIR